MSPLSSSSIGSSPSVASGGDRAELSAAAKQFEAIFLRQMLAAARKAGFGDDLLGNGGTETFRQMQDEHFADLAAGTGAFGMAERIEAQLAQFLPPESGSRG
ncbi:hypothetical protein GCM10011371_30450 [Novosphingobium marinum]|uniref:Flagellar protein FlgJ n=1 Tax=Novosphingobium marinum TaxID=1514948 RepID=A0A7Z0BV97_9SPHN|nr:rod-binding protein [Novosphingobium marinum]NYH95002.1 flagellar protein FlgJ [Novosphingobium marinum]GGC40924.1 hypothetical protein GCM10011371_30450 [Novosphingobium marinum]